MNFSLSANMSGFCSDSHILYTQNLIIADKFLNVPDKLLWLYNNIMCIADYCIGQNIDPHVE